MMKKSSLYAVFALGLALGFYQAPAAAMAIGFQSVAQTINLGDIFTVDVVVSGVTSTNEVVSAFDLDVTYDAGILAATGVTFSTLLGDSALFEADNGTVLNSGRIDFWGLSYLSNAELQGRQSDSFSLATFSFQALGTGTTNLLFDPSSPSGIDVVGLNGNRLSVDVNAASITVTGQPNPVSEPSTIWMCLLGFFALARRVNR